MTRRLLLVLALASTLWAQARTGTISGQIRSLDGTPAVGIRVSAIQSGDMMSGTLTDNEGRYELKGLAAGSYVVAAGRIGEFTYMPGTTDDIKATTITVRASTLTANIDFKLAAAAGVRIRGVVAAAAGNFPRAREAELNGHAANSTEDVEPRNEVVQSDGSFEFRNVLPGEYTIEFAPTGQDIKLKVGDTNLDDVKVKAPAVITGRVFIEDGGPLLTSPSQVDSAAVQMQITTLPADGGGNTYHQLGNTGVSTFTLPAGHTYQVEMYGLPFGYYVKSIRSGSADASKLTIEDTAGTRTIDVVLTRQRPATEPPGVTVRGRVTSNAPIAPGLQVSMTMTPALSFHAVRVDSDGSFIFRNVPPGPYSARVNSLDLTVSKPVIVRDENIDDVALTLSAAMTLKGRIRIENANGQNPKPSFVLRFLRTDNFGRSLAINGENFQTSLLEGTYRVLISDLPGIFTLKSVMYGSADASTTLTLNASKPAEDLVITIQQTQ